MKAVASMVAMLAVTMAWTSSAEATEAHIESFEFSCVTPDGQTLKPKLGDIGGAFYTGLPEQREQCLEAVRNMIALCRENVDFESNTKNQEFAGCLPIFEEQAQACVGHFKFEQGKCDAGGIPDGTTESAQEDEPEPDDSFTIEPLDTVMDVTKRANVRAGPGTDYAVLGTLDPGVGVRVTGAVQGLDWFRVDLREDGGEAFIHASLLTARTETAPDDQGLISTLSPRCSEIQENVKCWKETVDNPSCFVWDDYEIYGSYADPLAWSGACSGGVGEGQGTLTWIETGGDYEETGMLVSGVRQGCGAEKAVRELGANTSWTARCTVRRSVGQHPVRSNPKATMSTAGAMVSGIATILGEISRKAPMSTAKTRTLG